MLIGCTRWLALVGLVAGSATAAPGVRVSQTDDPAVTDGETVVTGDPAEVYATVLDYAKWTEIFPDVAKVIVTAQTGPDARVTLIAPDGHRDNLKFRNQPAARMIYFEDTGGRAEVWAEIVFAPGPQPATTRVHIRLFADVKGVASLVVDDAEVRRLREQKIGRQLAHMRSYFRRR